MTKTINTILLLVFVLSGISMAQAQCPTAQRDATNCKSLNDNPWDDEGFLFRELIAGVDASWKWEGPASFKENGDGTARLTGTIRHWDKANLKFSVDITFINQTYTPPSGSPYNQTGTSTNGWYYYRWGSAILTGQGDFAGGTLSLVEHMAAFQVGNGAHQQWADGTRNGASGWFEWNIVSQPTNSAYVFQPYNPSLPDPKADVCVLLSGTPTVCNGDPCATDATPPTITCPTNINLTTTGTCATATWSAATATDNCPGAVTVAQTAGSASGSCFPVGTSTITYKATDAKGNSATCSFTVTVTKIVVDPCATDATPPTITCPANINLTTTGTCATATWSVATATDNCPGTVTVAQTAGSVSGSCFPVGTSTITYKATDAKGNSATCSFTVTVTKIVVDPCATDATPPTITCPANINLTTTGTCATATWSAATATDNCPGAVTVAQTAGSVSGSCFPVGTSTITYKATDAKGNSATCSFTVTVTKVVDQCAGIVSIRPITNTKTNCNTGGAYVAVWNNVLYTAGSNLKFTEYTNGTATITGNVHANGKTFTVNATLTGRTCASAGSPKLGDGNGVCGANAGFNTTNWYYYTSLSGTMTTVHGTINLTRNGPAFQVGNYANLQQNVFGASGWFNGNGAAGGDFNINLGACMTCCSSTPPIACNNPPSNGFDPNKCYKIVNKATGKVLDVSGVSSSNYAKIHQWQYLGQANQQWRIIKNSDGSYDIKARNSGKLLDIQHSGGNCSNGVKTEQYQDDNTGSQQWFLDKQSDGTFKIRNRTCHKVIKVNGGNTANGADIVLWDDFGAEYFKWRIEEVACVQAHYLVAADVFRMNASADNTRTRIEWMNNTGYKTDYFEVQKADNVTGDYKVLEVVNATIKTNELKHYVSYDNNPTEGENHYRIKSVDDDGSVKFTELYTVNFRGLGELRVFPNPSNDVISIDLSKYKGQEVGVYLYNQLGTQVMFMPIDKVGDTPVEIDVNNLINGQFMLRVSAKGKRDITKQVMIAH
jgi:major membrane immunogen (membrane-anchored lipoprotein)